MKTGVLIGAAVVAVVVVIGATYMVDVDQTQEASLPNVDVTVEGGSLPEFEATVGTIDLVAEETTVSIPDIDVSMEETTISVPTLEITPPEG